MNKGHFLYIGVGHVVVLLATSIKLLDIKYEFCGFGGDVIEVND